MSHINLIKTDDYIYQNNFLLYVKHDKNTLNFDISLIENIINELLKQNFKLLSEIEIVKYFENILETNEQNIIHREQRIIEKINGNKMCSWDHGELKCRYCEKFILYHYFYCYDCHYNMCINCYNNNDEQMNKVLKLSICKNDHKLKLRNYYYFDQIVCDICDEYIEYPILHYRNLDDESDTYDLCFECWKLNKDNNLKREDLKKPCTDCDFGTIIDWIPILIDNSNDLILFNKNTLEFCLSIKIEEKYWNYYVIKIDKIIKNMKVKDKNIGIIRNILINLNII